MAKATDAQLLQAREGGSSYADIATAYGLSLTGVRGRVSRERKKRKNAISSAPYAPILPFDPLPLPDVSDAIEIPADDSDKLHALVSEWRRTKGYIKIMQVADLHVDDHNPQAVLLHFELARRFQPDLIVYTGDTHDFSEISRFPQSWRNTSRRDLFKRYNAHWLWVVQGLQNAAPNAVQVVFNGNHDERLEGLLTEFWQFAETLLEQYAALMRADGRVLWIDSTQEIDLGSYFMQHGTRTGENAAKNALKDLGWTQSGSQGHTHQPGMYIHAVKQPGTNKRRIVTYTVAPCSCNIPPAYQKRTHKQSRWVNGTLLTTVNLRGTDAHEQLILYHNGAGDTLVAAFAGDVISIPPPDRPRKTNEIDLRRVLKTRDGKQSKRERAS